MKKQVSLFLLFLVSSIAGFSQELNANVIINSEKVQTTVKTVFDNMKNDITAFLNNKKWTEDTYGPEERIKCNFFITLTGGSTTDGIYEGTIQVQLVRPVYNTSYETVVLNYLDKNFSFEYMPSQPMYFNENSYLSNLTSMLGYYAYVIIGLDYDTFSKMGGNPYFDKARNVLNVAQYSGIGWEEKENTGRYWLQENYNSQFLVPYREGLYTYHRLVLDNFLEDQDAKRKEVLEYLKAIKQINNLKPFSLVVKNFFYSKSDEFVNLFSKGDRKVREEAVNLLKELDPLNSEKYYKILKG